MTHLSPLRVMFVMAGHVRVYEVDLTWLERLHLKSGVQDQVSRSQVFPQSGQMPFRNSACLNLVCAGGK